MPESNRHLKPDETVQKFLISTTSRFVGEYESDGFVITHAWPTFYNRDASFSLRLEETPISRSGYIIAFETPPISKEPGMIVPDYSLTGEGVCGFLSVLFGKRFDCHGTTEGSGLYQIPNFNAYGTICNPKLPFNSHQPRANFQLPLELGRFASIDRVLVDPAIDDKLRTRLTTACSFYMQALQDVDHNVEIAYLHLITVGEILSSFFSYPRNETLDQETLNDLTVIEKDLDNGESIVRRLHGLIRGVKRTFVRSLCSLLDDQFFTRTETKQNYAHFVADDIEARVGAAYDLRSKYVHTGAPFGGWIDPSRGYDDIQLGRPVVDDRDFGKTLAKAPKFAGLERLMRYCILKFMLSHELLVYEEDTDCP